MSNYLKEARKEKNGHRSLLKFQDVMTRIWTAENRYFRPDDGGCNF